VIPQRPIDRDGLRCQFSPRTPPDTKWPKWRSLNWHWRWSRHPGFKTCVIPERVQVRAGRFKGSLPSLIGPGEIPLGVLGVGHLPEEGPAGELFAFIVYRPCFWLVCSAMFNSLVMSAARMTSPVKKGGQRNGGRDSKVLPIPIYFLCDLPSHERAS
jgi:hypothetical protein